MKFIAYPVALVTGPRQSGKTTLCRMAFPDKPYVSLEALDIREFTITDPRGFLAEYADGAIIDEIQHAPDLLSYIQMDAVEIKSGATVAGDFFKNLERFSDRLKNTGTKHTLREHIVYGGQSKPKRFQTQVISWRDIHRLSP